MALSLPPGHAGYDDAVIDGIVIDVRSPNRYIKKRLFITG